MNSNQIFEMALGLEKPWYVSKIEIIKPSEGLQGQIYIRQRIKMKTSLQLGGKFFQMRY